MTASKCHYEERTDEAIPAANENAEFLLRQARVDLLSHRPGSKVASTMPIQFPNQANKLSREGTP